MTPGRTLGGLTLRDGFGLRRPHFRRRRKQVGCCLFRKDGSAWCHSAASRSPGQWTRRKRKPGLSAFYPDRLPTFGFRLVGHLTHMGQLGIFFFLLASLLLSEIGLVLLFLTRAFLLAARLFGRHGCLRDVYITRI